MEFVSEASSKFLVNLNVKPTKIVDSLRKGEIGRMREN
jgi:hypothetical protein